ncbi:MAG TPA: RyR domain-containing protein [Armatimonadota bacterium]|jgi:ryanodine receptor 2
MSVYQPNPRDTGSVELPDDLRALTEELARNAHEVWAKGRVDQGWSHGPQRDDSAKEHPDLISYEELPEDEKEHDRNVAMETLRLILLLGYRIVRD